ncbi:methyltransferase [Verticiella alkaliphila]|uniref:methyltransferase n=1 Tax=Verticiella alkaliphila TaxID=2779529 RepID=UPI0035302DE4
MPSLFAADDVPVMLTWQSADGQPHDARWWSASPAPRRVQAADDTMTADAAFRLASEGTGLVWQSDYHNARQLLQALGRRLDKRRGAPVTTMPDAFHRQRQLQVQRARTLGMVLIPVQPGYVVPLRRAPQLVEAATQAWGPLAEPALIPLRDLLGAIGAFEWRRNGVAVPALGAKVHPHYGVFAPTRAEYIDLLAQAPLPPQTRKAFDIGTGTGVLAAVLARRGIGEVVATDNHPAALACARENIAHLKLAKTVRVVEADLFPEGMADLIVCNPPWVPGKAGSALDSAVYDPDGRMLAGFLRGLAAHLSPQGEGWLVLSDIAERFGLRTREQLLAQIAEAGLTVRARLDARPSHGRARDATDPLHAARAAEVTSLWRLAAASPG